MIVSKRRYTDRSLHLGIIYVHLWINHLNIHVYDTVYRFILRTLSLVYLDKLSYDKPADQDLPPYNPNVEAFTTGKISRYSPVYLIFNQEIPADRLKADRLGKLVRLKPDVPGKWASRITGRGIQAGERL